MKTTTMMITILIDCVHRFLDRSITPLKIDMERNHGGLEDHFPLKMGDL